MGDLMHALPALTEAKKNIPEVSFDWVVDKNFSSVPKWHPSVSSVIETNHREWKLNVFSRKTRNEIRQVLNKINDKEYDLIVDMQNNLKSAFMSYLIKHSVVGMDAESSREYPAHLAYAVKTSISKQLHAIDRQKKLLSLALGYESEKKSDYGIIDNDFLNPQFLLPDNFIVCVQNASWPTKQWSVKNWRELILKLEDKGFDFLFPSGTKKEMERAKEICEVSTKAHALELLPLNEVAYIIKKARFSICSDTGLAHLSAVTDTPSLTLYGPTNTELIGTTGIDQHHLVSEDQDIEKISVEDVLKKLEYLNFI